MICLSERAAEPGSIMDDMRLLREALDRYDAGLPPPPAALPAPPTGAAGPGGADAAPAETTA